MKPLLLALALVVLSGNATAGECPASVSNKIGAEKFGRVHNRNIARGIERQFFALTELPDVVRCIHQMQSSVSDERAVEVIIDYAVHHGDAFDHSLIVELTEAVPVGKMRNTAITQLLEMRHLEASTLEALSALVDQVLSPQSGRDATRAIDRHRDALSTEATS